MKRACGLCKTEHLHRKVDIMHKNLKLCFDCQEAITEMCRKEWLQTW